MAKLSNLQTRAVETLIHPYSNQATIRETGPLVFERGKGVYIYDAEGKQYLEGMAGLWCTALGYDNEELVQAATEQMRKLPFAHLFTAKSHDPAIELAEKLKEIAPVPISKVFFCNSGSEANDSQMKMVWYMQNALGRPNKKKIISRQRAYHGVTIAAASLTGLPANHIDFDLPIARVLHTSCPHHYRYGKDGETEEEFATRCATELEELILREGPETVAAFIAEPVMGAGGVIVPPKGYFPKIMAVCAKYDVFMIDDEVICGFGRLGTPFGCTALGYKPNSISVAKALSSAYLPIAGVMIPEDMYQALIVESNKIGVFGHGFTYSGHPVSAAVAVKTLEIYKRDKVFESAAKNMPQFQKRLKALGDHPLVGEARGIGMVGALELSAVKREKKPFDPKKAVGAQVVAQAQADGLIVRGIAGDVITICPPLIIKPAEIDELFDKLGRALDKT
ncbi:MAG: aminotransferase class III-fold pyridoxal phosphate-dependent enzyme, partial [Alphaproteobacteria bacterium]|nr:aminotransferase class III-fold pyridoxal phosphate-dependent enzyme [Alphaproteobacteria bacterium]